MEWHLAIKEIFSLESVVIFPLILKVIQSLVMLQNLQAEELQWFCVKVSFRLKSVVWVEVRM